MRTKSPNAYATPSNMREASGERLDVRVAREITASREEARRVIVGGYVTMAGQVICKPGLRVLPGQPVIVNSDGRRPFVSRGGEKLETALAHFKINVTGKECLDVGASTGGFTHCLLLRGAAKVYAVENGVNQFAAVLRDNPRVVLHEETDIRNVTTDVLTVRPSFACVDVSFISLTKVLPAIRSLLADRAEAVCLIKPQFEAGPGHISKRGIVRDETVRREVVRRVTAFAQELGFTPAGVIPSPAGSANREYLLYLTL